VVGKTIPAIIFAQMRASPQTLGERTPNKNRRSQPLQTESAAG
jgi:hypothetical protein